MIAGPAAAVAVLLCANLAVAPVGSGFGVVPAPAPEPSTVPAGEYRTFVDLSVNHEPAGKVLAVFGGDRGVLLARADLQQHGIPTDDATCISIAGACYVRLDALAPSIAYTFDQRTLALAITESAALLPKRTLEMGLQAPSFTDEHVRGNVLNYEINAVQDASLAGTLDDRFGIADDEVLEAGVGRTTSGYVQRTYTDLTLDDPSTEQRTVIGDSEAASGELGGSFEFGGLSVQREFSLDPYAINYPTPSLVTAITQPSQALIYVNGTLIKTVDLPPGYYSLTDLPVVAGMSNAQVVIRNAFGQTAFDTGTFGAITLLRKGLTDYQYGAGFLRENLGVPGPEYGPAVETAQYRLGISNQATVGGLVQSTGGLTDVGAQYAAQIGAGVIQAETGASAGSSGRNGTNVTLSFTSTTLRSSFQAAITRQTPGYTLVSSFNAQFQALGSAIVVWSRELARLLSVSLSEQLTSYANEGSVKQTSLGLSQQLGAWSISASAGIGTTPAVPGIPGGTTHSISVSLIRALGAQGNTSSTEALNLQAGPSASSGYELTSSAITPLDSSYDAVVQTKPGGGFEAGGWANLASPYGTLDLYGSPGTQLSGVSGSLQGAIVSTSRGTFFTQSVPDAYALVETGAPGASVYLSGMYAGKTNASGAMVVPFLKSNYANNISVSSAGLPITEMLLGAGSGNVGPSYHNGSLLRNTIERVHALAGNVLFASGTNDIIPMYGDAKLTLLGSAYTSPIDETGRVYFQGVVPGTYELTISVPGKTCVTTVKVPDFSEPVHDFGTIRCKI